MRCPELPFTAHLGAACLAALALACARTRKPPMVEAGVAAPSSAVAPASDAPSAELAPAAPAAPVATVEEPSPVTGPCGGELVASARNAAGDIEARFVASELLSGEVLCLRKGQTWTVLLRANVVDLNQRLKITAEVAPILAVLRKQALTPHQSSALEKSIWEVSDLAFSPKGDKLYFTSTLAGVGAPPQVTWQVDLRSEKRSVFTWGSVRPIASGPHARKLLRVEGTYDSPSSPTYRPGVIMKCELLSEEGKTLQALSDADCSPEISALP